MNTHTPPHEKHERFPIIKECICYNQEGGDDSIVFKFIFRDRIITASVTSHSNQPRTARSLARVRQDAIEVKKRKIKNHG